MPYLDYNSSQRPKTIIEKKLKYEKEDFKGIWQFNAPYTLNPQFY